MRDRVWIYSGLAVFVAVLTCPFWYALARAHAASRPPQLVLPANQTQCVAPVSFMRASHMQMLLDWREDVVRRDDHRFVAYDGKIYQKSLTRTCLGCHSKQQFCDRCHAYTGVSGPYCWDCHNDPRHLAAGVTPEAQSMRAGGFDRTQSMLSHFPKLTTSSPTSRQPEQTAAGRTP